MILLYIYLLIRISIYCVTQLHLQECFAKKSHRSARESAIENYSYTVVGDSSATLILMKFRAHQMDSNITRTHIILIRKPIIGEMQHRYHYAYRVPKKTYRLHVCPYKQAHAPYTLSVKNIRVITSFPANQ